MSIARAGVAWRARQLQQGNPHTLDHRVEVVASLQEAALRALGDLHLPSLGQVDAVLGWRYQASLPRRPLRWGHTSPRMSFVNTEEATGPSYSSFVDIAAEGRDAGIRLRHSLHLDMVSARLRGGYRTVRDPCSTTAPACASPPTAPAMCGGSAKPSSGARLSSAVRWRPDCISGSTPSLRTTLSGASAIVLKRFAGPIQGMFQYFPSRTQAPGSLRRSGPSSNLDVK